MYARAMVFAALLALGACASAQLTLSYPAGRPDADVRVGQQRYQLWFHETDSTVLIQRGDPRTLGLLLAENTILYVADRSAPESIWRAAGNAVLQQIGCEVTELHGAEQLREATYACVPGVNVSDALFQRRGQWQQGVHVDAPPMGLVAARALSAESRRAQAEAR